MKPKPKHDLMVTGKIRWRWVAALALMLMLAGNSFAGPVETNGDEGTGWLFEATNHLGRWIWDTNSFDKQTLHFWKTFEIPADEKILQATLLITVDNGYTLFLDGHEVGRGSDWRTVTKYDMTQLLKTGRHVLAVDAFNDRLEGGFISGLRIELANRPPIEVLSDTNWIIIPNDQQNWLHQKSAPPDGRHAVIVGSIHSHPWEIWPIGMATVAALRPFIIHFWQRGWFQLSLFAVCLLAILFCLWLATRLAAQSKAQTYLQVERARIARDIHDDLGAQLTQLLLLGEVAQREQPEDSTARGQFTQICDRARELAHAMDEVVWAVNSRRDTVRDFISYVCKYAQIFLSATNIRCRLDVEPDIPATAFDLPVRRNLFLAVKEALNNAAKHSQAAELFLRIYRHEQRLSVTVEDNGRGFDTGQVFNERNGLTNMWQRMGEIGGTCELSSEPGAGCRVVFTVPLPRDKPRWFGHARRDPAIEKQIEISGS